MQIGKFYVEQLSEGFFELFPDGTLQKIESDRLAKSREDPSLGKYSSAIGIDPLFISDGHLRIVVDPGLGWGLDYMSHYRETSNVITNLDIFDISAEDIDIVILTHLHYDHVAGSTYVNKDFETTATFPNAVYLVQQDEWEYAVQQSLQNSGKEIGPGYRMDELYKLKAENRLKLISSEIHKVMNGFYLIHTGGHTPGHQIIKLSSSQTAYYLGDLVPTEHQLNHYSMKQLDTDPLLSKKMKITFLKEALQSDAYMLFYHSLYQKSGKLSRDEYKKYILLDIDK